MASSYFDYFWGTKKIRLFDEQGKNFRTILKHDKFSVEQFAYSSCERWIAAVDERMVHLWTSTSDGMDSDWALATTVKGFFGRVIKVSWRPNTTEFATASEDGSIRAWKVEEESGTPPLTTTPPGSAEYQFQLC
ncbi:hypothetical protein BGX24_004771 [Mortierella sp. AD032]|nr:hypothetical protein BGX24_004771 [Mortierella sp. AD032]